MHRTDLRLGVREILGRPPLFDPRPASPTPPAGSRGEDDLASCRNNPQGSSMQPPPQPQIQLIQEGPLQPPPAMAATCPRLRGNPRIRASVPPPWHLFLYMPPTARARRHEIAASPCRGCMPPLPSAVWRYGRRHRHQRRRRQRPRRWPEDVAARVGLGPAVSPKRRRHGRIGHHVGEDGGGCDLDSRVLHIYPIRIR
jgi:hypothetical protein